MTASPQFQAIDGRGLAVTFDRKTGKLILPAMSEHDDLHRLCDWLTVVFALDPSHPITGGKRTGDPRPDRRARLTRAGAPALAFEPVAHISQAARLIDALAWQTIPTDSVVPAFKGDHCRLISQAVRMLCERNPSVTRQTKRPGSSASMWARTACASKR